VASPIRYLNVDLDLVAENDHTDLLANLKASGLEVLSVVRGGDGLWYAIIEWCDDANDEPAKAIAAILDWIEALDEKARLRWAQCRKREFNIGFDSGTGPSSFSRELPADLVRRIASCGASIAITIYPPEDFVASSFSGPDGPPADRQTIVEVDVSSVQSSAELHALFARLLGFPDYYGRNWDAFWDCVRDPVQAMPTTLRVKGYFALLEKLPKDARLMRECLSDLPAERREITIEWVP
jgi:ribonuclease inhibitor